MFVASSIWTRTSVLALCALSAAAFQAPAALLHARTTVLQPAVRKGAGSRLPLLWHGPRPAGGLALRASGDGKDAAGEGDEAPAVDDAAMDAFRELMQDNWDKVSLSQRLIWAHQLVDPGLCSARKLTDVDRGPSTATSE